MSASVGDPTTPRRALAGAALAAPVAVVAATAAPAEAAAPRRFKATKISTPSTRHALNRFTYGWTPALHADTTKAGGFAKWFSAQLTPAKISDSFYTGSAAWWPSINASADTIWRRDRDGVEPLWVSDANYQRWVLVRRVYSKRQVQEVMTEFFENHLHVPANGEGSALFRPHYGKTIRSRALGKFSDLLHAAITHPAMGLHLDNAVSTKRAPNENLGRELLELFTVGVGHYTEDDVKDSARILTGYRVDAWKTWRSWYEPNDHATGKVAVMGFTDANAAPDGRATTKRYLDYLARHPATAQRVARKLAIRFVRDAPSASLVNHLAAVYRANDTAIAPVLRALVAHPEFKASANQKVRTPSDDVVATYRVLGVGLTRPKADNSAANTLLWQVGNLGPLPLSWPRPDGLPDQAAAWSSSSRFLASISVHYSMAGGWWPKAQIAYRPLTAWVPLNRKRRSIRFDLLVDHVSRSLTGRSTSALMLRAACTATGCAPSTRITMDHSLVKWNMFRLLTVFLDSPSHMCR